MTQATLFTNDQCPPPPRPEPFSDAVLRAAAKTLLAELKVTGDDAERDVVEAIRYEDDGYRIARSLEDGGWDVDAETVETLNGAAFHKIDAHDTLVAAWVSEWSIGPKADVGARVRFKQLAATHDGIVDRIDVERAQYVVRCEALGHTKPGTPEHAEALRDGKAVTGVYVDYENAEVICE